MIADLQGGRVVSHPVNAVLEPAARESDVATPVSPATGGSMSYRDITLSLHDDMTKLETDWRRFEQHADCTVFQSFDWLSLWYRHIGEPADVRPAIVAGRDKAGALVFLMPLAVTPGLLRRLTFLGDGLCDYNAPLLAPGFAAALDAASFRALWHDIRALVQARPQLRHDVIALTKMPETVGAQINPFLHFDLGLNPSGAHLMALGRAWEEFYTAKRSSATRRRDRSKRKRLAEHGEVR